MPNMRRGGAPAERGDNDSAARLERPTIESRNGSDRAMPAPWRKRRREIACRVWTKGEAPVLFVNGFMEMDSLHLEQFTLHDFMHDGAEAKLPGTGKLDDFFDLFAIGEAHWGARRVGNQLLRHIARKEQFLLRQQLFEFADVFELATVGQFTGAIDRQGIIKREGLAI